MYYQWDMLHEKFFYQLISQKNFLNIFKCGKPEILKINLVLKLNNNNNKSGI